MPIQKLLNRCFLLLAFIAEKRFQIARSESFQGQLLLFKVRHDNFTHVISISAVSFGRKAHYTFPKPAGEILRYRKVADLLHRFRVELLLCLTQQGFSPLFVSLDGKASAD